MIDSELLPGHHLAPTIVMQVWAPSAILETTMADASWHDPRCCDRYKAGRVMRSPTRGKGLSVHRQAAKPGLSDAVQHNRVCGRPIRAGSLEAPSPSIHVLNKAPSQPSLSFDKWALYDDICVGFSFSSLHDLVCVTCDI